MPRIYLPEKEEEQYTAFSGPKLDLVRKLLLYGRQSTKEQVINNKEAYEQQTVKLIETGIELGWKQEDIILFIENKREDGKWRNASGRLRIDQRPGLQSLVERIERDESKTVLVWAVDRLFRDEDMIQPAVFVKICEDHHVVVLTADDYFDFNNPKRDVRKRFLEIAQAAADYVTKHVKGRMHPARFQVSRRGEFDGRIVATGFILIEGEKTYKVYEPHSQVMRYLFRRFRELDAQFNLLWREVGGKNDVFPPYPKGMGIVGVRKEKFERPFGLSYNGLKDMLTNPVYIGWWYFRQEGKPPVIRKNNHPAIVNEEDFWYAFNHISKTTITGEPIEENMKEYPTRFNRVGTVPADALLNGIVASEENGFHVYVFQNAHRPDSAAYTIYGAVDGSLYNYQESINVRELDKAFTERLKYRLRLFQALDAIQDKMQPKAAREKSMYDQLKSIQQTIAVSDVSVDNQISQVTSDINRLELVLGVASNTANRSDKKEEEELDEETIIKSLKRLKRLRVTLAELESKKEQAKASEEDLRTLASLIVDASYGWDKLPFERKRRLVRLITTRITIAEVATNWMKLDVTWSPYLGHSLIDTAFILKNRSEGAPWTEEENALLRSLYPHTDRDSILKALPNRTWIGILSQTSKMGLSRPHSWNNSPLHTTISYEDYRFAQEMGLAYSKDEPRKRVWWKSIVVEKIDASY